MAWRGGVLGLPGQQVKQSGKSKALHTLSLSQTHTRYTSVSQTKDKTQCSYPEELHRNLILTDHQFRQNSLNASQTAEEAKKAQSKCQISEATGENEANSV